MIFIYELKKTLFSIYDLLYCFHKFYINFMIFYDFFYDFLMILLFMIFL